MGDAVSDKERVRVVVVYCLHRHFSVSTEWGMGISGLWDELSAAAQKICNLSYYSLTDAAALAKLATDKWEKEKQCLTVAIDISIWTFQIQSGQKGSNPALRTFYYRLCRLLQLNIHPVFVFDGPQKPPFKRNKSTTFFPAESVETKSL